MRLSVDWMSSPNGGVVDIASPTGSKIQYPPNVVVPIEPGYDIALKEPQSSIYTNLQFESVIAVANDVAHDRQWAFVNGLLQKFCVHHTSTA